MRPHRYATVREGNGAMPLHHAVLALLEAKPAHGYELEGQLRAGGRRPVGRARTSGTCTRSWTGWPGTAWSSPSGTRSPAEPDRLVSPTPGLPGGTQPLADRAEPAQPRLPGRLLPQGDGGRPGRRPGHAGRRAPAAAGLPAGRTAQPGRGQGGRAVTRGRAARHRGRTARRRRPGGGGRGRARPHRGRAGRAVRRPADDSAQRDRAVRHRDQWRPVTTGQPDEVQTSGRT